MNRHRIVGVAIWSALIFSAVLEAISLTSEALAIGLRFNATGLLIIVIPVVVFPTAPLWLKGHPFDVKRVREWANCRFGKETYESYTRAVKPLLLLAAGNLVIGIIIIAITLRTDAGESAYVAAVFFISMAIGLLIYRTILHKQGSTIEW